MPATAGSDPSDSGLFAIEFDKLEWQSLAPGARFKAFRREGKQLRLVEFTPDFVEHDWCVRGHVGIVLHGQFEIDFQDRTIIYPEGSGIFIPAGTRHIGKHRSPVVRLFLVEEVERD